MLEYLIARANNATVPITPLMASELDAWLTAQSPAIRHWVTSIHFKAQPGQTCLLPGEKGAFVGVLAGVSALEDPWSYAGLPTSLPTGRYRMEPRLEPAQAEAEAAALGWALGTYRFTRYKARKEQPSSLVWPEACDRKRVARWVEGIGLTRDLINTPANDMGPDELAQAGSALAKQHGAKVRIVRGDKLLSAGYPAVHAVGRASSRPPLLFDMRWGSPRHPKLTLVGKGVCFDSGGLDLKNSAGMKMMKKDMGGAALVLGLAHALMGAKLPVRLRVLIPAAENSVSGNAFRPLDVIDTRKGLKVEIGNTDAEGRLLLCDALADADAEAPDLIVDAATLTGAARVALGASLPALFSNDDDFADALLAAGLQTRDPLWRMPLHDAYRSGLDSDVADLNNISGGPYGGAITAALFLREFISADRRWAHIDTMAWNVDNKPGRPSGGEALALRALSHALEQRYARGR